MFHTLRKIPSYTRNQGIRFLFLWSLQRTCNVSTMKIANLMALPPQVLMDNLFTTGSREIYYPSPLLKQWMKSSQPPHDSPSGLYYLSSLERNLGDVVEYSGFLLAVRTSPPLPPEPSSLSPPQRENYQDRPEFVSHSNIFKLLFFSFT